MTKLLQELSRETLTALGTQRLEIFSLLALVDEFRFTETELAEKARGLDRELADLEKGEPTSETAQKVVYVRAHRDLISRRIDSKGLEKGKAVDRLFAVMRAAADLVRGIGHREYAAFVESGATVFAPYFNNIARARGAFVQSDSALAFATRGRLEFANFPSVENARELLEFLRILEDGHNPFLK